MAETAVAVNRLLSLAPALIVAAVCLAAAVKGVDIMDAMTAGARRGLRTAADMLPALVVLFSAIWLLRASGLPDMLTRLCSGVLTRLGIPPETTLILLLRPLSGSGALSAAAGIMQRCGADSLAGRTAAVMLASGETTFYVTAVYFGASGVKGSRWAIPAALIGDAAGFLTAAWICRVLWG